MLVPFQTSGSLPGFFMVHGLFGLYVSDPGMVNWVGPDRPLYGITAPGYHGDLSACTSVSQMAEIYVKEIVQVQQSGPYLIGAFCEAGKVAIEVARRLADAGRVVGPVLLIDPGTIPYKNPRSMAKYESAIDNADALAELRVLARDAMLRLCGKMKKNVPFDPNDPGQLDNAASVAMTTKIAITRFVPAPYRGATELILSSARAPGFFQPDHEWQRFLPGPRVVHVIEGEHMELVDEKPRSVRRLVRAFLDRHETAADR